MDASANVAEAPVAKCTWDRLAVPFRQSMRAGFAPTFVTERMVLVASVAVIKMAAHRFPESEFASYLVARRAVSLAAHTVLMGMGIALPRYVALECQHDETRSLQYLLAGAMLLCCALAPLLLLLALFPHQAALLVFGQGDRTDLIFATACFVIGFSFHTLVYGYFRGHLRMWYANGLQFAVLVVAPPTAIIAAGSRASRALTAVGVFML